MQQRGKGLPALPAAHTVIGGGKAGQAGGASCVNPYDANSEIPNTENPPNTAGVDCLFTPLLTQSYLFLVLELDN